MDNVLRVQLYVVIISDFEYGNVLVLRGWAMKWIKYILMS